MEMNNVKNRLDWPAETEYLTSLGRAVMCFARCEWQAVWCCERLNPGYLRTVSRKMAGTIADDFLKRIEAVSDTALRATCLEVAREFKRLVARRNDLLHAQPGTERESDQRLFRNGVVWLTEDVDALYFEFAACDLRLNETYYGFLKDYNADASAHV